MIVQWVVLSRPPWLDDVCVPPLWEHELLHVREHGRTQLLFPVIAWLLRYGVDSYWA